MNIKTGALISLLAVGAGGILMRGTVFPDRRIPEYQGLAEIDVIAICYFEDFYGKGKTISLEYVTRVDIRDRKALSKEVDEVWENFRSEAERLHAKHALVNPNSSKTGGISTSFVFEASGDGQWTRTTGPANRSKPPSPQQVGSPASSAKTPAKAPQHD